MTPIKVKDSTAASCRWAEEVFGQYFDWDVIDDKSYRCYQGDVYLIATDGTKYIFVEYSYGSCSGCDGWDAFEDKRTPVSEILEIQGSMNDCVLVLDNEEQYQEWLKRRISVKEKE